MAEHFKKLERNSKKYFSDESMRQEQQAVFDFLQTDLLDKVKNEIIISFVFKFQNVLFPLLNSLYLFVFEQFNAEWVAKKPGIMEFT